MKRVVDVVLSGTSLVVLAVPLLIVALIVRVTSPGPAIYRQVRVGRDGRQFTLYKFRSMAMGADKAGHATAAGDSRITTVGRVIRKTSVDELPQLLNVLKGEMSLVGPRPYVPAQEADYNPSDWHERHTVRPGITGLAQVRVRSAGTPEQVLAYDLEYVRHRSLGGDFALLFETATTLLKSKVT